MHDKLRKRNKKYVLGIWIKRKENKYYVLAKEKDVKFNDTVLEYSEKINQIQKRSGKKYSNNGICAVIFATWMNQKEVFASRVKWFCKRANMSVENCEN